MVDGGTDPFIVLLLLGQIPEESLVIFADTPTITKRKRVTAKDNRFKIRGDRLKATRYSILAGKNFPTSGKSV